MALVTVALLIGAGGIAGSVGAIGVAVLAFIAFIFVALVHSALQGIYSAALFQFVTQQPISSGFNADELQMAFRQK